MTNVRFLVLALVVSGCAAPRASTPSPAPFSVEPSTSAPARHESLRILGANGLAAGAVSADFGAGVTGTATVAGPALILAEVDIASDAALGPRRIAFTQGSKRVALDGAFAIVPPFTIEPSSIPAGAHTAVRVHGLRTHWTTDLAVSLGPDVSVDGVRVDGPDDATAFVRADLFATPGTLDADVAGERVASAAEITPAPIVDVPAGGDFPGSLSQPGEFAVWHVPASAAAAMTLHADPGPAIWEVYVEGTGITPAAALHSETAPLDWAVAGREVWIALHEPAPATSIDYHVAFSPAPITGVDAGSAMPGQSMPAGGVAGWSVSAAQPWSLVRFDVDASNGTMAPNAVLARTSSFRADVRTAPASTALFATVLAPRANDPVAAIVSDANGGGASAVYDFAATVTPLAGELASRDGIDLPVGDASPIVSDSVTFAGTASYVSSVHVALDLAYPWRGDLEAWLTSPWGTTVPVFFSNPLDDSEDWITAFPDLDAPASDLGSSFAWEAPQGDWTLTIVDDGHGLSGVLRGWAISVE